MTQAGGPAALNGFLYQILQHLGWVTNLTLSKKDNTSLENFCLILEPSTGGDARIEAGEIRWVEQYKSRAKGTWSVNDIITKVLPDLAKAAQNSHGLATKFRFVTDGREGKLDIFRQFLADAASISSPSEFDSKTKHEFGKKRNFSHSELFLHIATQIQGAPHAQPHAKQVALELLRNFEMVFEVKESELIADIDAILRRYAPDLGVEQNLRQELIARLHNDLAKGELRLDLQGINELFLSVKLNPERMRNLAKLSGTMGGLAQDKLKRLGYQKENDVRQVPVFPENTSVLLIAGDSGNGKTWQLCKLIDTLRISGEIVVMPALANDASIILRESANLVWQSGLGETNEKTLRALTHQYCVINPGAKMPWLTIAVDDVQNVELARQLLQQSWPTLGMRLVFTAPSHVARSLESDDDPALQIHSLGQFSIDELDQLLRRQNITWASLPSDLRQLLRTPILAGIYKKLPREAGNFLPQNEYEIFEKFWIRIAKKTELGDEGVLLALAERVLAKQPYPVARSKWSELGVVSEQTVKRLVAAGWLQCDSDGELAFAHDRLLNWAVARVLVAKINKAKAFPDEQVAQLIQCAASFQGEFGRNLGYVPMDVIWALSDPQKTQKTQKYIVEIVERLEQSHQLGVHGDDLYRHLLPTTGARGIPILLARLMSITANEHLDSRVFFIRDGFAALAKQTGLDLSGLVAQLLESTNSDWHRIAFSILAIKPMPQFLGQIWALRRRYANYRNEQFDRDAFVNYQDSFAAIGACLDAQPEWLREQILQTDSGEAMRDLAFLLERLPYAIAKKGWLELKSELIAITPANLPRGILGCITRFKDLTQLDFIIGNLSCIEDSGNCAALSALTVLAPDLAIVHLAQISESERCAIRHWWLPMLQQQRPAELEQWLLHFAASSDNARQHIQRLFCDSPADLPSAILRRYLRLLENELQIQMAKPDFDAERFLDSPLDFLASLSRLDQLDILALEADSGLARMICDAACSQIAKFEGFGHTILTSARRVLIAIGGKEISRLINTELASSSYWGRRGGLEWAMVRPDDTTRSCLIEIAKRLAKAKGDDDAASTYQNESSAITLTLASVENLVPDLLEFIADIGGMALDVARLIENQQPLSKSLTRRAYDTLAAADTINETELFGALLIAWLSADPDFIIVIESLLDRLNPKNQQVEIACRALISLGATSNTFAEFALKMMATQERTKFALGHAALREIGSPFALKLLIDFIQNKDFFKWSKEITAIIYTLFYEPITRAKAIEMAVQLCREHITFWVDELYFIAAESHDLIVKEKIYEAAFEHSNGRNEFLNAIDALSKFNGPRAFEAACTALMHTTNHAEELCQLIASIDPQAAASKLVDAAIQLDHKNFRPAVGRILRQLPPLSVDTLLIEKINDTQAKVREVAIALAAYLPDCRLQGELERVVIDEPEKDVRHAALAALAFKRREQHTLDLIAAFRACGLERRWPILLALLEMADPFLLADSNDKLWYGHFLKDVPSTMELMAEDILKKKM